MLDKIYLISYNLQMIMNDFLRIWQIDCNPGIQYNTIQYNTIQYNTIQYNYYFKFFKLFIFNIFNSIKKYKIYFEL